ncbi:Fe-S oxidoreductase [uncultured Clostridium sp.]|uniref:radical SAM protein n=1 Tax=uncultured Clostridium sp. TaxID=59620 RepID=UPI0028E30AD2|nr:Fe-S oxidoreductase [uncultured Clostridium sp.]
MNFSEYMKNSTKNIVISKVCSLLEKNPSKNMDKLFNLSINLIKDNENKKKIKNAYTYYNDTPLVKSFVENILLNINPNFLKKFTINFFNYVFDNKNHSYFPFFVMNLSPKDKCNEITYSDVDTILNKVKENKIYYVFIIGKEPFSIDFLYNIYKKYSDIVFIPLTNGELLTPIICNRLYSSCNVIPIISLDGFQEDTDYERGIGTFDKIMSNMDLLKQNSIPFGISSNISLDNIDIITSNEFIDMLLNRGAFINLYFYDSIINEKKQKLELYAKLKNLRINKSCFPLDFLDNSINSKILIDKNGLYNNELKLKFNNIKYCFNSCSLRI